MQKITYAVGVDISTQTVSAALVGVRAKGPRLSEIILDDSWRVAVPYGDDFNRRTPDAWVELSCLSVQQLQALVPEARTAVGLGVSTTFPGIVPIHQTLEVNPELVWLYDNTQDVGLLSDALESYLASAEQNTLNRIWPGSMAVGLTNLLRKLDPSLNGIVALVPPNTAFAHALLKAAGHSCDPRETGSDFTETVIGGLYDAGNATPLPRNVCCLLRKAVSGIDISRLRSLLPAARPSWTNIVPSDAIESVRRLLDMPALEAVSIGAGDSSLGALALCPAQDAVLNVRGSSDTPVMPVDSPKPVTSGREVVLHYPMPTAASVESGKWCTAAPILRTGRVWDWVRRLRFDEGDANADAHLERVATDALIRKLSTSPGGEELLFRTSLGGERAPSWDPQAKGSISGLTESDSVGEVALAALEGMSVALRGCIELLEARYNKRARHLVLAGGPTRNRLWNWVTEVYTGKETRYTEFSDASVLGAAVLGQAAQWCDKLSDWEISAKLSELSALVSEHPLIVPKRVEPPPVLASLSRAYAERAARVIRCHGERPIEPGPS